MQNSPIEARIYPDAATSQSACLPAFLSVSVTARVTKPVSVTAKATDCYNIKD